MNSKLRWLLYLPFILLLIGGPVSAQLKADFTASPTSGCPPLVVSFTDQSTGSPLTYKWDLGNGTITYSSSPIATYFNPGKYTVKLVVTNASGADSVVKSEYIVVNPLPNPLFKISDSSGCFPLKVQFTDMSTPGTGTVTNWQWDFGDGNLSNAQSPSHTYTSAGSFNVTLRVTNSVGCSKVITRTSAVQLFNGVVADFNFTSGAPCSSPTPVTFTNSSSGTGLLTYKWNFGDGNTSTLANPIHNYTTPGTYSITLIATNSFGCADTIRKANAITIGFVNTNFTRPDSACANSGVVFTNTSTPAIVSSTWYFSDGTSIAGTNANKVFTTPGIYQVKLVNNYGGCMDSITKSIKILPRPKALFSISNNSACKAPITASFTNSSTGATSYKWNFGDGASSTLPNPTHTYATVGIFSVTLIATNASGCSDTLLLRDTVRILPPKITAIKNLDVKGCLPYTVTPVATISANQAVASYSWNFGDGGTSTDANPTYTYTTAGSFNVKLVITTVSGCKDSLTIGSAVMVGNKPKVKFGADPKDVCALIPIQFTDSTSNVLVDTWYWKFGDGSTSTDQNPKHQYSDTGYFNVTLIATNFGCSDTLKVEKYIYIRPPIAKFDTAFLCNDRLTRSFIDKSIGANAWEWTFGDGSSSTLQSPVHTYVTPGVYKVKVKVTNGICTNEKEKDVIVIKENGTFTISDTVGCRNARIIFGVNNVAAANIQSYTWYFDGLAGAPVTTTTAPVANSYGNSGLYPASVVVKDILSCSDTLNTIVPINIYGPKADFIVNPAGACLGSIVTFTDSTLTDRYHPITSWNWYFGDGNSQTVTTSPLVYTYGASGTYNIKMVAMDSYGCSDSITKSAFVSISKPVAKFTPSDTMLCPGTKVTFTNASQGGVNVTYAWKFGDGTTATTPNASHSYSMQGVYRVSLLMQDSFGCSDSAFVNVEVFNAKAAIAMSDSFSSCPPLLVDFSNKSTSYVQWNWDFGDGGNSQLKDPSHMYTYPGNYSVKLWVRNNGGCTDTITKYVNIQGPTGIFNYNPLVTCNPGTISFTANTQNATNYIWDYNDGTTIYSTTPASSHTYTTAGLYIPKLILEDAYGCRVPIVGIDTLKINGISTFIKAQSRVLCDSGMVVFSDSTITNDGIGGYMWDFGDGNTSTQANPTHNYKNAGWYTVKLITKTMTGCVDTAVYNNYIKIVTSPKVRLIGDTAACEPATLNFSGGYVVADTSAITWNWNFGNGQTANVQNPPAQLYPAAGSYTVMANATNSDGCIAYLSTNAIVHPKPVVDAGLDTTICKFVTYRLQPSGASSYLWSTNSSLSCMNCPNPDAYPMTNQTYYVTGTSAFGCSNSDSVVVKVKQPFKMTVSNGDTLCLGQSKVLSASGAEFYNWSPSLYLDNSSSASPKSTPTNTITYTVVGNDDRNCFKDSAKVTLKVYPIPTIDILNGDAITISIGTSVKINTASSPDVTKWNWTPLTGLSCSTCPSPTATPTDVTTYSVVASNDGKCVSRDKITITPICNNGNIYLPNTFSPNGDGANDVFYPRGTGVYGIRNFRIYNRWGQIMFDRSNITANNASLGWDGTVNGNKVQPDVYVYSLEVECENNAIFPIKGNITLIR